MSLYRQGLVNACKRERVAAEKLAGQNLREGKLTATGQTIFHGTAAYCVLGIGFFVAQAVIDDRRGKSSALTLVKRAKWIDVTLLIYAAISAWTGFQLLWAFVTDQPESWERWVHFSWPVLIFALPGAALLIKRSSLFWMPLIMAVLGLWAVSYTVWGN
jgi:hypothetical protein